jgi:hypothetical protein
MNDTVDDDLQCVTIHGRLFQKVSIDHGIYCVPVVNDELEEDRLTAQHNVLLRLFGNMLFSPHIRIGDPKKILECGYGGGDWSVQCAEEYEDCEVRSLDSCTNLC